MQNLHEFTLDWVVVAFGLDEDQEVHPMNSESDCCVHVLLTVRPLEFVVECHLEGTN